MSEPRVAGRPSDRPAAPSHRLPGLLCSPHRQEPKVVPTVWHRNHGPHSNLGARPSSGGHPDGYLMTSARRCAPRPSRCPSGRAPGRSVLTPSFALAGLATHRLFDLRHGRPHSPSPHWGPPATPARAKGPQKSSPIYRSSPTRQISNPNKEPASPCGLVHCTVSSACGTKRSPAPGALEPPQPDETYIGHTPRLARIFLKTGLNCQFVRRDSRNAVLVWSSWAKTAAFRRPDSLRRSLTT